VILEARAGKLRRFLRQPAPRRRLLFEASAWLVLARLAVALLPFRLIVRCLGVTQVTAGDLQATPGEAPAADDVLLTEAVRWAVDRSARHLPFKAVCLPQAIAAMAMLQRRGIPSRIHFGLRRCVDSDRRLEAHAWLDAGGVEITGYPVGPEFVEVACFRSMRSSVS
jgi:hypothetical protein